MDTVEAQVRGALSAEEIAHYRRRGYLVVRRLVSPALTTAAIQAIAGLASGALAARRTKIMFERGVDPASVPPAERENQIRKFADYVEDAPALMRIAMLRPLHAVLDQLLGQGRVLFQDMALIKPPHLGSEQPWHQD